VASPRLSSLTAAMLVVTLFTNSVLVVLLVKAPVFLLLYSVAKYVVLHFKRQLLQEFCDEHQHGRR